MIQFTAEMILKTKPKHFSSTVYVSFCNEAGIQIAKTLLRTRTTDAKRTVSYFDTSHELLFRSAQKSKKILFMNDGN